MISFFVYQKRFMILQNAKHPNGFLHTHIKTTEHCVIGCMCECIKWLLKWDSQKPATKMFKLVNIFKCFNRIDPLYLNSPVKTHKGKRHFILTTAQKDNNKTNNKKKNENSFLIEFSISFQFQCKSSKMFDDLVSRINQPFGVSKQKCPVL